MQIIKYKVIIKQKIIDGMQTFVHLLQTAAVVNELIGLLCSQSEKLSMCVYVYVHVFVWCCVNNLFKNLQGKHMIILLKQMLQMCLGACCGHESCNFYKLRHSASYGISCISSTHGEMKYLYEKSRFHDNHQIN